MNIEKVLVSDPTDQVAIDLLTAKGVKVDVNTGLNEGQLIQIIPVCSVTYAPILVCNCNLSSEQEYDALIVRSGTTVTAKIIEAGKKLKVIGRAGVGVDNIDVPVATKQGVLVIK